MSKMKLQETEGVSSYHARLEYWTSRELQLNILHEEIINKREALLRTTRNFLHSPAQEKPLLNNTDATIRNNKLLKDINSLEEYLTEKQQEPINSRFANLQHVQCVQIFLGSKLKANYKSMVENMFPIWQKSLKEVHYGDVNAAEEDS